MGKIRYSEKRHLCKYDLSKEFFDSVGINILDVTPLRKVFVLKTLEGKKVLKKIDYSEDKLKFIEKSLEYIRETFPYVMNMDKLPNGECFINWGKDKYIIMDLIEGRETSLTNPIELEMCGESLGRLHKSSLGIKDYLIKNNVPLVLGNDLIEEYKNIRDDLINIKEWVSKYTYKNEFDNLFLEISNEYIDNVTKVIDMLWVSNYRELLKNDDLISICHNDLANHNFLINENNINIIDFDYSTLDLRAVDIGDFLLKWTKNSAFNIEKGKLLLESYNRIFKITEDEYKLIYILLTFPRDIYSIIRSYYHKSKEWEEEVFLNRFKNKLENDILRKNFLKDYIKFYQ